MIMTKESEISFSFSTKYCGKVDCAGHQHFPRFPPFVKKPLFFALITCRYCRKTDNFSKANVFEIEMNCKIANASFSNKRKSECILRESGRW